MTSPTSSDASSSKKKRPGRKRLPPLPPGPRLQFIVGNHPDDFRDDQTMRNIRSHVMHKHRSEGSPVGSRASSTERSKRRGTVTRTPSPMTALSDGYVDFGSSSQTRLSMSWDDEVHNAMSQSSHLGPVRSIAARIITATVTEETQSAPPTFGGAEFPFASVPLTGQGVRDDLKNLYLDLSADFYGDRTWMQTICSSRMALLSHVSVTCVYQDLADRLLYHSELTEYARTNVVRMVQHNLETEPDDFTILSILHLLISEVGGFNDNMFDCHQDAILRIVQQRGGINTLGLNGDLSSVLTVVMLCSTILRGHSEPPILHDFIPNRTPLPTMGLAPPISPLYCPGGDMSRLFNLCPRDTYALLLDMHELTHTFILRWSYSIGSSSAQLDSYEAHMQQIFTRILLCPSKDSPDAASGDWVYESIRLAALIYCGSIVQGVALSESANQPHALGPAVGIDSLSPETYTPLDHGYTRLSALHNALEHTDRSNYWGELCGVFLWIHLVGGAASWQSSSVSSHANMFGESEEMDNRAKWMRKSFALYAVRAALGIGFENPGAVVEAQRNMGRVLRLIGVKRGIRSQ